VRLHDLQRDADSNRALYETFLNRFKETREQADTQRADVVFVSHASVPLDPSFPRRSLSILGGFIASLVAGVGMGTLIERLDDRVRTADQIEALGCGPLLAMVPELSRRGAAPEQMVLDSPLSVTAEAMRMLQVGIAQTNQEKPPRAIMFTSAVQGEGKTFVSISFARVAAKSGLKVILMEADMRRPRLHHVFHTDSQLGLAQILMAEKTLAEVIVHEEASGLDVLPAGRSMPNPGDLLRAPRMRDLLAELQAAYDLVVLDTPPLLAVADARSLCPYVERTVLVVKWNVTPTEVVRSAIRQIRDGGHSIAGTVISRVNLRKNARYDYGGYGYYYSNYGSYYATTKPVAPPPRRSQPT
jgi:succinoglycan biosynthesis transport protein ExoP